MENNPSDSGSRVTRSLRKRLTSVDGDNSSRPGTPSSLKLTSISEISASPARSTRMTRRNSTSVILTPVKTPAKRTIVENLESNTPARRSSRRRSSSINENEGTPQVGLKISTFPALDEETIRSDNAATRVTRSQSKSPQQSEIFKTTPSPKKSNIPNENQKREIKDQNSKTDIPKGRKSGPKSKIRENGEDTSDVEISVLGNEIEDIKNKSSNITTIILTDDESIQMTSPKMMETENNLDNNKSTARKIDFELPHKLDAAEEISNDKELQIENNVSESSIFYKNEENITNVDEESIVKNSEQEKIEDAKTSSQSEELVVNDEKQNNQENENQHENMNAQVTEMKQNDSNCEEVNLEEHKTTSFTTEDVESNTSSKNVNQLDTDDFTTPKTNDRGDCEDSNITNCQALAKKVEFVSSPNDMAIKNVYPKTPASTKSSKSFKSINSSRKDGSFLAEFNSFIRSDNALRRSKDNNIEINNENLETQITETNITPVRDINCSNTLDSSVSNDVETSICKDSSPTAETNSNETNLHGEIMETGNEHKSSENKISDNDKSHSSNQNKEELKWIDPCVKGTATSGSKLDNVDIQNNKNENVCTDNAVQQTQQSERNNLSTDEEKDLEAFEFDFNQTASEEDSYKQKHDFHDDEAMEVNNYESGDSMDSEERKEIEENEIPVDSRSLGSHTTEDDHDEIVEEEDSDNADSFIVSDEEELKSSENNEEEEEEIDKEINEHNNKIKAKTYKRVLHLAETSSSSDEELTDPQQNEKTHKSDDGQKDIVNNVNIEGKLESTEEKSQSDENVIETNQIDIKANSNSCESITETNNLLGIPSENINLDTSKLSDSAFRLHCTAESESEEEPIEKNISRNEFLRNLNQSDRFNKSVHHLNPETDATPMENSENSIDEDTTSTSSGESDSKLGNDIRIESENQFGEASVTFESDPEKENEHNSLHVSHRQKNASRLNISSGSYKNSKGMQECERSFIKMTVSIKDGKLGAEVNGIKLKEPNSTSSSPTDDGENKKLKSKDISYLENIRHMPLPLGNPLIRTRRQSLALPTNPDMEICPSHMDGMGKKTKRKSLGILSSNDFNPSQSFIESIELQKNAHSRNLAKRKRLSKSFCGYSETHDNSIVDVDICHLHKKSKLMSNNSMADSHPDSIDNISSSKLFTKVSSTPYDKISKNNSYNNKERILRRCDEILEAANRAKLEAKTNSKKNKVKISKKLSKKKSLLTSPDETNPDDVLRKISKEIKRKDKTKTALSQAIRAADNILSKKKKTHPNVKQQDEVVATKLLAPDVLKVFGESAAIKKKCKKETTHYQDEMKTVHTSTTSAGNFTELPQTPEKKKKKLTYIQLPTGKVSVEPITPKRHLVKSINGMEFRESPITPAATGFKVRQIAPPEIKISPSSQLMDRKRKRYYDESLKNSTLPKSNKKKQWTQSGLFVEEEIPKRSQTARSKASSHLFGESQKTKKRLQEHNINLNFKENAMMRPDIRRSSKREMFLLKERRQV